MESRPSQGGQLWCSVHISMSVGGRRLSVLTLFKLNCASHHNGVTACPFSTCQLPKVVLLHGVIGIVLFAWLQTNTHTHRYSVCFSGITWSHGCLPEIYEPIGHTCHVSIIVRPPAAEADRGTEKKSRIFVTAVPIWGRFGIVVPIFFTQTIPNPNLWYPILKWIFLFHPILFYRRFTESNHHWWCVVIKKEWYVISKFVPKKEQWKEI